LVSLDELIRAVTIGTMAQEHYHAILRRLCHGNDNLFNLDGAMSRADLLNWLRGLLDLLTQDGVSRERTKGGDVHMPAFDGASHAGVPPIGHIVKCGVVSLSRLGVELPRSVQDKLRALDMMPDIAAWGDDASFVHELVAFGPAPQLGRHISTTSRRSVNLAGVNNMKLYSTGRQLVLGGKGPCSCERGPFTRPTRKTNEPWMCSLAWRAVRRVTWPPLKLLFALLSTTPGLGDLAQSSAGR
jgi:hypothetical protein